MIQRLIISYLPQNQFISLLCISWSHYSANYINTTVATLVLCIRPFSQNNFALSHNRAHHLKARRNLDYLIMKEAIVKKDTSVDIVDSPIPKPGPGHVLIKVIVAGRYQILEDLHGRRIRVTVPIF